MRSSSGSTKWTAADLVDFECALSIDRRQPFESLIDRDKAFLISKPRDTANRSSLFLEWIRFRRKADSGYSWPGQTLSETWSILKWIVWIGSAIFGAAAATSLLVYNGTHPINVAWFLAILVMPQVLFSLISLTFTVVVHPFGWVPRPSATLAGRIMLRLWSVFLLRKNAAPHEEDASPGKELVARMATHRKWLGWKLYTFSHISGVAFNLGILCATLFLITFSDRAFGWQSTIRVDARHVHMWVERIAFPWAAIWEEGQGYPTLSGIESSRVNLNAPPDQRDPQALASWWSFLVLSIAFYGLIPRVVFAIYGSIRTRAGMASPFFDYSDAEDLWNRLHSDRVGFRPTHSEKQASSSNAPLLQKKWSKVSASSIPITSGGILLAPPDVIRLLGESRLSDAAETALGTTFSKVIPFKVESVPIATDTSHTLIVEAWEPPIEESLQSIRQFAEGLGSMPLHILFTGMVIPDGPLTKPAENDLEIWTNSLKKHRIKTTSIHTPLETAS
ncbi:MAG: DUF2868 domain-containing protein [Opitutales bacterium]|nr:DUF2868 domain-containing protein [Opitutales bacterium]